MAPASAAIGEDRLGTCLCPDAPPPPLPGIAGGGAGRQHATGAAAVALCLQGPPADPYRGDTPPRSADGTADIATSADG